MTRRSFIADMLKCGVATTFLPGAGRIWKPTYEQTGIRFIVPQPMRLVPFWWETQRLQSIVSKEYEEAIERILSGGEFFNIPTNMKVKLLNA